MHYRSIVKTATKHIASLTLAVGIALSANACLFDPRGTQAVEPPLDADLDALVDAADGDIDSDADYLPDAFPDADNDYEIGSDADYEIGPDGDADVDADGDADGDTDVDSDADGDIEDLAPIVKLTATPNRGLEALDVRLTCAWIGGSEPVSYEIIPIAGDSGVAGDTLDYTYASEGIYSATCRASDADGDEGTHVATVTVLNNPPTVELVATPGTGEFPLAVLLECIVTDGNAPFAYHIDSDDDTDALSDVLDHTYTSAAVYSASCEVEDADGDIGSDITSVTVTAPPPCLADVLFTDCTIPNIEYDPETDSLTHSDGNMIHHQEASSMFDTRITPDDYVWIDNGANTTLLRYIGVISGDPATTPYTIRFENACTGGFHDVAFDSAGWGMGGTFIGGVRHDVYSDDTGNAVIDLDGNRWINGRTIAVDYYFTCP